jgi:hypothetical protein
MAIFYGEELSTPRPNPKLEDHPLSAVRDCLFNIFAATLHIGGRSSIRNPWTRPAMVTATTYHGIQPHFIHIRLLVYCLASTSLVFSLQSIKTVVNFNVQGI